VSGSDERQYESDQRDAASAAAELATALRDLQKGTPLSLRSLAKEVHVSASTLSRYLRGAGVPPLEVVEQLAAVCAGDAHALKTLWLRAATARNKLRLTGSESPVEIPAAADAQETVQLPRADGDGAPAGPGAVPPAETTPPQASGLDDARWLWAQVRRWFPTGARFAAGAVAFAILAVLLTWDIALRFADHPDPLRIQAVDPPFQGQYPQRTPGAAGPVSPSDPRQTPTPPGLPASGRPGAAPGPVVSTPPGRPSGNPVSRPTPSPPAGTPPASAPDPVVIKPFEPKCQFTNSRRASDDNFRIDAGGTLRRGQVCQTGKIRFTLEENGDLVLRRLGESAPKWQASWGRPSVLEHRATEATFQPDHKFVLSDPTAANPVWTSGAVPQDLQCCGYLQVQSDGNVVIYTKDDVPIWATDTK
jgi:transcriptional regulator with XRE-family HTH domain